MGKHRLSDDRIMWPTEDEDDEEKTARHLVLPDVPPIIVPEL